MNITIVSTASASTSVQFLTPKETKDIIDFEAKPSSTTVRYNQDTTTISVGLGHETITREIVQNATAAAIRCAIQLKRTSVAITLPKQFSKAALEAISLAAYRFSKYQSDVTQTLQEVEIISETISKEMVTTATARAQAVCLARDLQNENASIVIPEYLAQQAREIANTSNKITLEILQEDELTQKGLNLITAVGQGAATPPRLIIMNYIGNASSKTKQAIVGKGVTFDTGGMNLKPSGSMETMRMDMSGAAATLGVMKFLAETEPAINVIGVVPTVMSALGKDAYYVGDTYTSYSGKTVEVLNTDAEGRLILADAISYTVKNYQPTEIIDIATLTGAILVALGDSMAGIFSNNKELATALFTAGENSGDRVWELPIRKEHREAMKSDIADLRNISKLGRKCGSITAAAFLENFVESTPWAHIDIAGTAWNDGEAKGIYSKYGTGFGVRLLLSHLLD